MGSTRLANLPDEAQLASRRHAATAAVPRAAATMMFSRRNPHRPNYHLYPPTAYVRRYGRNPRCGPPPHLRGEDIATGTRRKWGLLLHGESNVVRAGRRSAGRARRFPAICALRRTRLHGLPKSVAANHHSRPICIFQPVNLFDCATVAVVLCIRGAQRICAMIEMVTALMALVSAGIFLAHAFEGYHSRA